MKTRLTLACLLALSVPWASAADSWTDITRPLIQRLAREGAQPDWPGGCSGVVVDRLTGNVTVKVVGHGLWQTADQGLTWKRLDAGTISGRDETGWATSVDQNQPARMASFSLDGTAGWTTTGRHWKRFADLGRNWDYGSVDWSDPEPRTIIAAKHETSPPGEVYVSTNGGSSWTQLTIHLKEDRGQISMVGALDATTFIYSNGQGIHRSTDTGAMWSQVSDAHPQTRIPVFFRNAHYLGTASGLLVSKNRGATWRTQGVAVDIWQGPYVMHSIDMPPSAPQSSGRSPCGAILTSLGSNRPRISTRSACAAIT